jgi:hypothetical protein
MRLQVKSQDTAPIILLRRDGPNGVESMNHVEDYATSDEMGRFRAERVRAGRYRLTVPLRDSNFDAGEIVLAEGETRKIEIRIRR